MGAVSSNHTVRSVLSYVECTFYVLVLQWVNNVSSYCLSLTTSSRPIIYPLSLSLCLSLTDAVEKEHVEDACIKKKLKTIAGRAAIGRVAGGLAGTGVGAEVGAGVGTGIGAVVGSIVPGPGSAIRAAVGTTVGAGIGALSGVGVFSGIGAGIGASIGAGVAAKNKSKITSNMLN